MDPGEKSRENIFQPCEREPTLGDGLENIFSPVCFDIYFTGNVHERRRSAAEMRDSGVRAGLLETGTGEEAREHKYQPPVSGHLCFSTLSLSFYTHGGPAHFLTNPIPHSAAPDFPLQLLLKTFQGRYTWSDF